MTGTTFAPFIHPETGEVLEAQHDFLKALDEITERMIPLWKIRSRIREAHAERFEAPLPSDRRNRTQTQERVHRCPRCGLVEGDLS